MFLRTIALLYFVCLCSFSAWPQAGAWQTASSQEVAAAYSKAAAWFTATPSYFFKLKYTSFKNHHSNEQIESSEGYYKRVSNNYVTEAMGIKTLQNGHLKLIIDTIDRRITMMNPGKLNPGIDNTTELETLLAGAKTLKKATQAKNTRYRIDFNKNEQYEAYEFVINDKGVMTGLTYYYSEQIEKEDGDGRYKTPIDVKIKPRLEITFFDYQVPANYADAEFSGRDVLTNGKGKPNLTASYKDYRLLDYRSQTKN